jgi:hypothetical protein
MAGLLAGFDWAKINDPNHKTTKYNFARVAMNYDLSGVHDKATAEDLLASMKDDFEANGVPVLDIDGDKIKTRDNEGNETWVDVIQGSGSDHPNYMWAPLDPDANVRGGGLARHGLQSGVPAGQQSHMPGATPTAPAMPKTPTFTSPAASVLKPTTYTGGGGPRLEGFDPAKLADPTHKTPKYQFARVAQNYDLASVKDKASAEALLKNMAPQLESSGVKVLSVAGDAIQTIDPATGKSVVVDVIKGANSGNPAFQWLPKG